MTFPIILQQEIEVLSQGLKTTSLSKEFMQLSERYRGERQTKDSLLKTENEALAYAAVRMPATYGAVSEALAKTLEVTALSPQTMLDVGAGTGACGWAANEQINLAELVCLEREKVMRHLGQYLMSKAQDDVLQKAQWVDFDLLSGEIPYKADLVTASYVVNELADKGIDVVEKLWQATKQILLIIEPGTPKDFANLLKIRGSLLEKGAYVLAPCPHQGKCPLSENDWCHFCARIARSRLHRQLKGADMGYEDEKYCFMAFSKISPEQSYQRLIKEPTISKAEVKAEVCTAQGEIERKVIPIRDKATYKNAKKWRWGNILP